MTPTLDVEAELAQGDRDAPIAGIDEVGRGALAGPVTVGVVVVSGASGCPPARLTDSKLLRPAVRRALVEPVREWCVDSACGHAWPAEIDRWGITVALRLAARRALTALAVSPRAILLDGSHDWLSLPPPDLLSGPDHPDADPTLVGVAPVTTRVKADMACASVAAASVLAKVCRDTLMEAQPDPGYGWASNKGYGSAQHLLALRRLGPSETHRRSWKLPAREECAGE